MIIPMLLLASGIAAALPIEESSVFPLNGTSPAKQSNVYNMWCAGRLFDSRGGSVAWQTNYFDVTSDNIEVFQDRVFAIVREEALKQDNLAISPSSNTCVMNQTNPQDFNERRHSWEARMTNEGVIHESFFIIDIVEELQ